LFAPLFLKEVRNIFLIHIFQNAFDHGFEFALALRVQGVPSRRAGKGWAGGRWAYYLLQYVYL